MIMLFHLLGKLGPVAAMKLPGHSLKGPCFNGFTPLFFTLDSIEGEHQEKGLVNMLLYWIKNIPAPGMEGVLAFLAGSFKDVELSAGHGPHHVYGTCFINEKGTAAVFSEC